MIGDPKITLEPRIPIVSGEFYDFPRMIKFQFGRRWFFLQSFFDEERDEYSEDYDVYLLPFRSREQFESNPYYWMNLNGAARLGQVCISEIGLDETRRRSIDSMTIVKWLLARGK